MTEFARQAGITLIVPYDVVKTIETGELKGEYVLSEGLYLLLQDTGLSGQVVGDRLIVSAITTSTGDETGMTNATATQRSLIATIASIFITFGSPVSGQETAQGTIEEIVVTAQKREQTLNEVPISMQILSGAKIQEQGFNTLEELITFVPGVIIEQGNTGINSTITVRGITQDGQNTSFEQSTAVFNDGTYYGRPLQSTAGIYDLAQVEVLFGPQPVYFGQSAIAGLLSYRSVRPTPGEFDGYSILELGDIGNQKVEGAVSVPLGDSWGLRLGGKLQEDDGWTTAAITGVDSNAREIGTYRLGLSGEVGENFSTYIKHERFESVTSGINTDLVRCEPSAATVAILAICADTRAQGATYEYDYVIPTGAALDAGAVFVARFSPFGNLDLTQLPEFQTESLGADVEGSNSVIELNWDISNNLTVTSLTGYSEYDSMAIQDFDDSQFASLALPIIEEYEQFSQELRLTSNNDGPLNWMAGLYFQDQDLIFSIDAISALTNPMGPSGTNALEYGEEAQYTALFASFTYDLNDAWSLDIGGRWQDVAKDAYLWEVDSWLTDAAGNRISNTGPGLHPAGTPFTTVPNGTQPAGYSGLVPMMVAGDRCLGNTPNNDDCDAIYANGAPVQQALLAAWGDTSLYRKDDDVSPDIALRWNFGDTDAAFLRYVEGFKAGGFSRATSALSTVAKGAYDPETAKSVELGIRMAFFDRQLRWNGVLYNTEYKNQQVRSTFVDEVTLSPQFIFINAAEATIRGFETDISYSASNGFFANWAMAYNDTGYDSFTNSQCFTSERADGDCQNGGTTLDLSGREFDGLPDWTMNIGLGYDFTYGNDLGLRLTVDGVIFDDWDNTRPSQRSFQEHREQDSFSVWNARAELYRESWSIALYGRNITDELYWMKQPDGIGVFGVASANVSRPATFGLTLRYNFGQ